MNERFNLRFVVKRVPVHNIAIYDRASTQTQLWNYARWPSLQFKPFCEEHGYAIIPSGVKLDNSDGISFLDCCSRDCADRPAFIVAMENEVVDTVATHNFDRLGFGKVVRDLILMALIANKNLAVLESEEDTRKMDELVNEIIHAVKQKENHND